jgi:FtsK/SpoIIIE family
VTTLQDTPAQGDVTPAYGSDDSVRIAVNAHGEWVRLRWSGMENPHVLIVGGSQSGKTTLERVICAAAGQKGLIVFVLDTKLRFGKQFRDVPHVRVFDSEDPMEYAQMVDGVLQLVVGEMQRRYRADADSFDRDILDDREQFPTILVVADELGVLFDFCDREWQHRKPEGYKGDTPAKEMWHTLMRMGAEARCLTVSANQSSNADELPAGTKTRALCGQRIVLGNTRENSAWYTIAGHGTPKPDVPSGQRGAGVMMVGDSDPFLIQGSIIETKDDPLALRRIAIQGVSALQKLGHVTSDGQLLLGGKSIPSPATLAWQVASFETPGSTPRTASKSADQDDDIQDDDDTSPISEDGQEPDETPLSDIHMIVGNAKGAEFCGITERNFRRLRELYPIPGEARSGNKPCWPEIELRDWSRQRAEERSDREDRRKKGA